jgi:hypothetical protein
MATNRSGLVAGLVAGYEPPQPPKERSFTMELCRAAIPLWNYDRQPNKQESPIYDQVEALLFHPGGSWHSDDERRFCIFSRYTNCVTFALNHHGYATTLSVSLFSLILTDSLDFRVALEKTAPLQYTTCLTNRRGRSHSGCKTHILR